MDPSSLFTLRRLRVPPLALAVAWLLAPAPAAAQTDSVTVVAGERYEAGPLHAWLLGRDYRDLWTTPIRVPVLDLDTYAGGLTPVRRGSGAQTVSLRFRAPDGREYNFRSVDKDQTGGLHPDFRETLIDRLAQDQVSAKYPAAALIAGPLLDAAGVMHPAPRLYVMPDDPRLGEFRETFAGMLGTIEVHPDEGEDDEALFEGALRVAGTERLLEHLDSPDHRADAREFLRARLMDFLIGDWDRHVRQWRWARYDRGGVSWWLPVPEDRDNAFSSYDGVLLDLVGGRAPWLAEFDAEYSDIYGLTHNAQVLDRRLLSELPREAYESMARELQARLTDGVIERAVASAPPEYVALRGAEIAAALRARRDALPDIARRFYEQLAREVDIRATDEPDLAVVDRLADGSVQVRLYDATESQDPAESGDAPTAGGAPPDAGAGSPYFARRFLPDETREVRIYLHGGADRAVVRGDVPKSILVRVIGGGGADVLVDSSRVAGRGITAFYDHRGDNTFLPAPGTVVDTRAFQPPAGSGTGFTENAPAHRDWGREVSWFEPWAAWRYNIGPVIGGGPRVTRYGFRRAPYAHSLSARVLYGPLEGRFGLEAEGDFRRTNSLSRTTVRAYATQLQATRFHGFGNDTPGDGPSDLYKIFQTEIGVEPLYHHGIGPRAEFFFGPLARYTRPELEPGGPAAVLRPIGSEPFWQLGGLVGGVADLRDLPSYPRRGAYARLVGSGMTGAGDLPGAFGSLDALATTYLPLPLPLEATLALRLGGRRAWGDFPLQEAAFIGGPGSLRGFPRERFAGDASAFAGAEIRTFLTRFRFISRGDLGAILLADAGRVFVDGRSPGGWHTGLGGGIWLGILDRTRTLSVVVARGEQTAAYVSLGVPF